MGLAERLDGMGYRMDGWYFDRLDYDGMLLLSAFQVPGRRADGIVQTMPSHVYPPDTLRAILARFGRIAAEAKLPALDLTVDATEDTSEDGFLILWRELAPGLLWGEQYNESDGSLYAFRLVLQTGALIEEAELWTAVAMHAMNETETLPPMPPPNIATIFSTRRRRAAIRRLLT